MKVYALIRDYGYEGHCPPEGIYDSRELAEKELKRLDEFTIAQLEIHEYELNQLLEYHKNL